MSAADWVSIIKWIIVGVMIGGLLALIGFGKMNTEGALAFVAGAVAVIFGGGQLSKTLNDKTSSK